MKKDPCRMYTGLHKYVHCQVCTVEGSYFIAGKAELSDVSQLGVQGREGGDLVMGEIHDPKMR